ncbi:hypothetical protein Cagg_3497 [Chloroflexus aggregans DSM 9485]|uniref:Uncharacterized protein n=2 Tax=Chloroflexus aggregans TaxID=152260 RepID=B8G9I3_CHLAD|nr:hypothetical protein Cagg_3497 [Chloroflexus aggregans DSM 9485]
MRCHGFADSIRQTGEVRDNRVKDRRIVDGGTAVIWNTTAIIIPRAIMASTLVVVVIEVLLLEGNITRLSVSERLPHPQCNFTGCERATYSVLIQSCSTVAGS